MSIAPAATGQTSPFTPFVLDITLTVLGVLRRCYWGISMTLQNYSILKGRPMCVRLGTSTSRGARVKVHSTACTHEQTRNRNPGPTIVFRSSARLIATVRG